MTARRTLLAALIFGVGLLFLAGCRQSGPTQGSSSTTRPASPGTTSSTVPVTPAAGGESTNHNLLLANVDPSLLTGNFARCPECHSLLDRAASKNPALTEQFAHSFHLEDGAKCDDCHEVPTHTEIEIRKPSMVKYFNCHSQTDASAPPGTCSTCHSPDFPLKPAGHSAPDWLPTQAELVSTRATHPKAAQASPKECQVCHAKSFCDDCHGLDMPHPADWQNMHPDQAAEIGGQVCMRCHFNNETCSACHHPGYKPGGPPWWKIHPQAVYSQGPDFCLRCHSTLTCAHCHTTGEYKNFAE